MACQLHLCFVRQLHAGRLGGDDLSTAYMYMMNSVNGCEIVRVRCDEFSRPTIPDSNRRHEYIPYMLPTNMSTNIMQENIRPISKQLGGRRRHPMGVLGHGGAPGNDELVLAEVSFVLACCLTNKQDCTLLLRTLKQQLNITEHQADVLSAKLQKAQLLSFEAASATSKHVKLCQGDAAKIGYMVMPVLSRVLQHIQPADFQSYAEFTASCNSCVTSIGHIAERLMSLPPCVACVVDSSSDKVHGHMARVRGCLRRAQEPEERYFSTTENADATASVAQSVDAFSASAMAAGMRDTDVACRMAMMLMAAQYDDLSDDGFVAGRDKVLSILQGQVLPRLGVDQHALALISAWVSAERFITTKETEYLHTVQSVLRNSNPNAASRVHDGMSLADQAHTCRIGRQKSTGAAIMNTFSGLASDTFQTLTPEQLAVVLDIIRMTSPESATVPQLLHEYVGSSADKEMERIWGPVHSGGNGASHSADDMERYMSRTRAMLHDTAAYLREVDQLATSETPTEATVVRRCHSWVGTAFMTWIDGEPAALAKHIQVVRDAAKLEMSLVEVLHRHGKSVQRWAGAEELQLVLEPWMHERNKEIKGMVQRLMSREQWTTPATPTQHIPDTPMELQRVCAAAMNAVLEMNVPTSGAVMRTQLELVGAVVHLFVRAVTRGCDAPAKLIRPAPPLTRYKEDLLKRAAKGEHVDGMSKLEAEDPEYMAAVREYHQQLSKREVLSLDHVLLRVNSTAHLNSAMVKIVDKARSEYTQVLETYNMDKRELATLEGALDESAQELQQAESTLTEFLAHSAIFVSMSDIWYRKLYKHRVLGAAAADVGALRAVDDVLGQIMVKAFPEVVESTVAACARATFSAMQNTLLNGGEYRYFSLDDADLLQSDLTAFKGLLNAEGQGVSMEAVADAILPLQDVIHTMSIPTSVLCNAMDSLLSNKRSSHSVIPQSCMESRRLLCILSHRKDRAASKFLKERMKMPKLDGKRRGLFF